MIAEPHVDRGVPIVQHHFDIASRKAAGIPPAR
jgi:hypothetical protein